MCSTSNCRTVVTFCKLKFLCALQIDSTFSSCRQNSTRLEYLSNRSRGKVEHTNVIWICNRMWIFHPIIADANYNWNWVEPSLFLLCVYESSQVDNNLISNSTTLLSLLSKWIEMENLCNEVVPHFISIWCNWTSTIINKWDSDENSKIAISHRSSFAASHN